MNKLLILLILISTSAVARLGEVSILKQSDYPNSEPPVQLNPAEYIIFSNKGTEGKPYFMQCTNGTADDCNFNMQALCVKGTTVPADPFGKPHTGSMAKGPSFMTYPGVGRVRIFMCVDEE
ncbi:hypothetical protein [Methylotenera sp. N17]|uniref:hypothetical protein n=1 Tax=Methylotenera sp. N17 TaxID=1502761 RepID=UPI000645AD37|nr:hypothetical protein [Methylotenera sp. N17]